MKILPLLVALLCFGLTGCTAPQTATKLLQRQGYTHVRMTGWSPFTCGRDDVAATGLRP